MFARRTEWNLAANRYSLAVEHARDCAVRDGRPLLDLTASNPTTVGLHFEGERILRALQHPRALEYEPASKGILAAREAVAAYYAEWGVALSAERIILTVSTSEAYSYCFRLLCDPGDEVLVPQPSYPLFAFLADIQDVKLVPYELVYDHGWQIEFESLRRAITPRSRAIMVVHPNNPTGHFTRRWELERLNALCREKSSEHPLALVADEVFLDYGLDSGFSTESPLSFVSNDAALTFTLSGLSKICALPQIKVAWIAASGPSELVHAALERLDVIADTYLSPNAPVQWAVAELLATRDGIQRQLRQRVQRNLRELDAQLQSSSAKMTTRLEFDAGWYAVLRTPSTRSDEEIAIALLEQANVLIHPGHFFDFPGAGYLVASVIAPEGDFREGMARVLRALDAEG
jgi:aspartate/methionine/tyrosine aminotransferase